MSLVFGPFASKDVAAQAGDVWHDALTEELQEDFHDVEVTSSIEEKKGDA